MLSMLLFLGLAAGEAGPLDFTKIPREIAKAPEFVSSEPLYGLFLFGNKGETRMWAVFDKTNKDSPVYDVLYFDVDADGDLTEPSNKFAGTIQKVPSSTSRDETTTFTIGTLKPPGGDAEHTNVVFTWTPHRQSYKMLWRGKDVTMGPHGPDPLKKGLAPTTFGKSIKSAPIFVPGCDGPFQFEHWMSDALERGDDNCFKVFIGNKGSERGAFSCVDDKFLPKGEYVVATLIYTDRENKQKSAPFELRERS